MDIVGGLLVTTGQVATDAPPTVSVVRCPAWFSSLAPSPVRPARSTPTRDQAWNAAMIRRSGGRQLRAIDLSAQDAELMPQHE